MQSDQRKAALVPKYLEKIQALKQRSREKRGQLPITDTKETPTL